MSGILSWLRKHFSAEWWRSRCQCLRGDDSPKYDGYSSRNPNLPMTVQFHDIRSAELSGFDNPAYCPIDVKVGRNDKPMIEVPAIKVQPPPPPEYSTLERATDSTNSNIVYAPGYGNSFNSHRRSYRPHQTKIISQPSITSDYVSDTESDYHRSPFRSSASGRYSSRKTEGRRKHRQRHRQNPRGSSIRSYTHSSSSRNYHHTHKMRKYPTGSLTSDRSIFDARKPITRRHSIDTAAASREKGKVTSLNLSISISRKKDPSFRSSVRERKDDDIVQNQLSVGARPKDNSIAKKTSTEISHRESLPSKDPKTLQKSLSLSPMPHKPGGLVRNETILEVPIYLNRHTRPVSAHAELNTNRTNSSTRQPRQQRKSRHPKPPRSHKLHTSTTSNRGQPVRIPRSEKWLYGYASLPSSWNNIEPDKLEQAGLTRESLMESLERLDFDKLCRPVPTIPSDEQLNTPRLSVVETNMAGEEKEILKDTYKLKKFDIVTTDL